MDLRSAVRKNNDKFGKRIGLNKKNICKSQMGRDEVSGGSKRPLLACDIRCKCSKDDTDPKRNAFLLHPCLASDFQRSRDIQCDTLLSVLGSWCKVVFYKWSMYSYCSISTVLWVEVFRNNNILHMNRFRSFPDEAKRVLLFIYEFIVII